MPIKQTGLPWVFIPDLSINAKVLLLVEMQFMIQYFSMAHGCRPNSYVFTYLQEVKKEIKLLDSDIDRVVDNMGEIALDKQQILNRLAQCLSSSRQKSYCRDVLNTTALHISNEVRDSIVTRMLNSYIDEYIDVILR